MNSTSWILLAVALVPSGSASAASFTFSEKISQQIVYAVCTDSSYSVRTTGREKSKFKASLPLAGNNPGPVNYFTPVEITIGNWAMSFILGDSPGYVPGRTSVTFMVDSGGNLVMDRSDAVAGFRVRWSATKLTVQGLSGDLNSYSIAAEELSEQSGPINTSINASIRFGDALFEHTVPVTGTSNPIHPDLCGFDFTVENISIKGRVE